MLRLGMISFFQEKETRVFMISSTPYSLHEGDLVFLPHYMLHQAKVGTCPINKRTLFYFDDFFCNALKQVSDKLLILFEQKTPIVSLNKDAQKKMSELILLMTQEQINRDKGWLTYSTLLLGEVLFLALRCSYSQNIESKPLFPIQNPKITAGIHYIQANFHNKLSLEDVASKLYIHPTYFCRLFKQEIGINFVTYVNTIRIEYAKEQLLKSKLTLKEISELSGFENDSTFSHTFKQLTGISPSKYRKEFA